MATPNHIPLSAAQLLGHTTTEARPQEITFTQQQLASLEKVFPEIAAGSDAMSDAKVRHHLGQRSVVAHIRSRVR